MASSRMLKKGKPYRCVSQGGFKDPVKQEMERFLEDQKRLRQEREQLENSLISECFENYFEDLSYDDIIQLLNSQESFKQLKENVSVLGPQKKHLVKKAVKEKFKQFFADEVWPEKKNELLSLEQ